MGNLLYNILLVEDDKEIIKNLTEFLNNEGFVVNSVTGQKDALLYVDEHMQDVDIVVLDVSLEDGNGFAVCTAIKQNTDIPVIFLAASGVYFFNHRVAPGGPSVWGDAHPPSASRMVDFAVLIGRRLLSRGRGRRLWCRRRRRWGNPLA